MLRLLEKGGGYANKLAKDLGLERKVITFHLNQLSRAGLIESKYSLGKTPSSSPRPFAIKEYKITVKGKKILDYIQALKPS
jgi:predicted ArsR family transcriptional regulator